MLSFIICVVKDYPTNWFVWSCCGLAASACRLVVVMVVATQVGGVDDDECVPPDGRVAAMKMVEQMNG